MLQQRYRLVGIASVCAVVIATLIALSGTQSNSESLGAVVPSADVTEAQSASLPYVNPWQALAPVIAAHNRQELLDAYAYAGAINQEVQRQRDAAAAAAAAAAAETKRRQQQQAAAKPTATYSGGSGAGVWHDLAMCETGGKMDNPNTGNGYFGFFQFSLSTWRSVGGTGYPHEHSYGTQQAYAQKLQARSGWGPWPACSKKLGLR